MAMNNDTNDTTCDFAEAYQTIGGNFRFATNKLLTPTYFFLGLFGRAITLLTIYKERKKEGAYAYQIFVLVSELFAILTFTAFVVTVYWWSGLVDGGATWFKKCYACVWYTAYLANFLENVFMSISLLLTLSMTVDRTVSLAKPLTYRNLNHKKIRWIVLACCVFCGTLVNVVHILSDVVTDQKADWTYERQTSTIFGSTIHFVFMEVHSTFKLILVVFLSIGNFLLFYYHRRRMRERAKVQNRSGDQESEASKTLFKMTVCQSVCSTVLVFADVSYHLMEYVAPLFKCWAYVYAPFVDAAKELADLLEFFCVLAISKRFRGMVARTIIKLLTLRCGQDDVSNVQVLAPGAANK